MPLTAGTRLGPYEILSPIGAGGMGEVYCARDTKLDRDVAIKVLPEEFAADAERLARFEREAKLLASLNHPNIASVFGFEESPGVKAIVLELVEGPTLADRIAQGPLPLGEAVEIATQIASALEAGHAGGVIHRDLKPANVKLDYDGTVKVLDYGLAKAFAGAAASESDVELSQSPTLTRQASQAGVILGTAAYMSPEQAKGKRVDSRTDLWALGVVLYEMLAGRRPFTGETVSDVLAAVIQGEPDWSALPSGLHPRASELVTRCLRKDATKRLQHAGDARIALDEIVRPATDIAPATTVSATPSRTTLPIAAAAAIVTAIVTWGISTSSPEAEDATVVTRSRLPGVSANLDTFRSIVSAVAIAPDGRHVAYISTEDSPRAIRLLSLDDLESRVVSGSEFGTAPAFSPDGRWLAFRIANELMKVPLSGGAPTTIARGLADTRGVHWSEDGFVLTAAGGGVGLSRIPEDGGDVETVTEPDRDAREKSHRLPVALPGGRHVLFTLGTGDIDTWDEASIALLSLESGEHRVLIEGGTNPRFSPSGHIVYARAGSLLAVPFDIETLELAGTPVTVVENVAMSPIYGHAEFGISASGTLVYARGGAWGTARRLVWVDRDGTRTPITETDRSFDGVALSPDERHLALTIEGANPSIWLYDLARGTMTRFASGFDNDFPGWTPDGRRVTFRTNRGGAYERYAAPLENNTGAFALTAAEGGRFASPSTMAWAPDGNTFAFVERDPTTGHDIWMQSADGTVDRTRLIGTELEESYPSISPGGDWIVFSSNDSGRNEIYVQRFPDGTRRRQVSTDGGYAPMWSRDAREIFYWHGNNAIMAVSFEAGAEPNLGQPRTLFSGTFQPFGGYDVAADGRFVLVDELAVEREREPYVLVQNWFSELERLVPAQ